MTTLQSIDRIIETTSAFKVLSDPTRVKILCALLNAKGELCVNQIAEQVSSSHSAVSHQLGKLEARGIVEGVRRGQTVCYTLTDSPFTENLRRVITIFDHAK